MRRCDQESVRLLRQCPGLSQAAKQALHSSTNPRVSAFVLKSLDEVVGLGDGGYTLSACSQTKHVSLLTLARVGLDLDADDLAVLNDNDRALGAEVAEAAGGVEDNAESVGELTLVVTGWEGVSSQFDGVQPVYLNRCQDGLVIRSPGHWPGPRSCAWPTATAAFRPGGQLSRKPSTVLTKLDRLVGLETSLREEVLLPGVDDEEVVDRDNVNLVDALALELLVELNVAGNLRVAGGSEAEVCELRFWGRGWRRRK